MSKHSTWLANSALYGWQYPIWGYYTPFVSGKLSVDHGKLWKETLKTTYKLSKQVEIGALSNEDYELAVKMLISTYLDYRLTSYSSLIGWKFESFMESAARNAASIHP